MSTELSKTNNGLAVSGNPAPLAPGLTIREQRVVKASQSARCADLIKGKRPDVVMELTRALNETQAVTGQVKVKQAGEDSQLKIIDAMVEIVKRYKWLRIDELRFIIREGMIGEYGEVYGFNALMLNNWIKAYHEKERVKAIKKQVEFEAKQQSLEEEAKKKKEMEESYKFNRRNFIDTYHLLQIKHKEAIENGELDYTAIARDIDPMNTFYSAFKKKWDNTLGFELKLMHKILDEETQRERNRLKQAGDWVKFKDEAVVLMGARSNARSRLFRMRIALMLLQEEDIEQFFEEYGI